jgi:hypothetical protein
MARKSIETRSPSYSITNPEDEVDHTMSTSETIMKRSIEPKAVLLLLNSMNVRRNVARVFTKR